MYLARELIEPLNLLIIGFLVVAVLMIVVWIVQGYRIEREVGCVRHLLERIVEEQEDMDYAEYKKKAGDEDA
jgi:hypothetical protein